MRIPAKVIQPLGTPALLDYAEKLVTKHRSQSGGKLAKQMAISPKKAAEVQEMYTTWSTDPIQQIPAVDAFIGDIYSGLQVQTWTAADRDYAHKHLLILSGLYGALRACDGIMPYRLEMGYKLPDGSSLYAFWGDKIASHLPTTTDCIINLSAVEYTKALLPYNDVPVIAPKFLTISLTTGEPTFVTVHTKIARGAFARWLITERIDDVAKLQQFSGLNYRYDASLSTPEQPVFVASEFGGIGLSVRLTK